MNLKKALEVQVEYQNFINRIHIDPDGYFNLNDMVSFFPGRRIDVWMKTPQTKEFLTVVESMLNHDDVNTTQRWELDPRRFYLAIKTKRGRYGGGTYAHKYVAMKFAMWLSPEFELEVIKAYENGVERKEAWDIQRIMAANGYKFLVESVKEKIVPEFEANKKNPYYAFTEEADMLNLIVFGKRAMDFGGNQRDFASSTELQLIEYLQRMDSGLIEAGLNYDQRFEKLTELCNRKRNQIIGTVTKQIA